VESNQSTDSEKLAMTGSVARTQQVAS
jgi:hypothetical protein